VTPSDRDPILRYSFEERLTHWIVGLAYLYLLLSGLALFTPHLYWLAAVLGSGPTVRFWHPWVGILFSVAILWMHRIWYVDMSATEADRQWNREVGKYIENRDEEMPPAGRFNSGQKQFYWVMLWGMFLLLVTGIVMWVPEYIPRNWMAVRPVVVILHEIGALITIGAFIVHVYMGLFVVPGGMNAIVHGYVSRKWAWAHHRLWYNQVAGKAQRDSRL
jgi:formate dehydrogenase subunit gamma